MVPSRYVSPSRTSRSARTTPAVHREQERDRDLGHRVGVAPGRPQHRDALRGGGGDVDVVGVAAARADREQRQVEHRALHGVGLDDEEVGVGLGDQRCELLAVEEAQGCVVDPRVEHDVGEALEGRETLAAERGGDERAVKRR